MLAALAMGRGLCAQQAGLEVGYGAEGLERLAYRGQILADIGRWPADKFHIWHMKCFDKQGRELTDGDHGWGENNKGRVWDATAHAWTYTFSWGTVTTQFRQAGDTLKIIVSSMNDGTSNVIFDGASVYPVMLHFPEKTTFSKVAGSTIVDGAEYPAVTTASWTGGTLALVASDAKRPGWSGLQPGAASAEAALFSSTWPDALPRQAEERRGLALEPGQTMTQTYTLRFGPDGSSDLQLAPDAYEAFAKQWPQRLHWPDRRVIGTVYLASSPQGDRNHPGGFSSNPRRYFNEASIDVSKAAGLAAFQQRVLMLAANVVETLTRVHAQGVVTWDIEGEEYPQDTSYVCAPDQIASVAPEMESIVLDRRSKYAGMKLDDAYFRTIHDAGFRVGVCVRPQVFVLGPNHTASQRALPDHEVAAELIRKMKFAHDRWGATLFYLDSTVRTDGSTLPSAILEQAATALPDSLLIPEESTPRMSRATAPFATFLFHGDVETSPEIHAMYPQAFSANLVNDVNAEKLAAHRKELVHAVQAGDVLMIKVDAWQPNDTTVNKIYRSAKTAP